MNISVVIPCHNCASWLGEALRSVSSQQYQPYEVIVVNDASRDAWLDVVRAHAPDALVLSVDYHNAAAARNHAVAQARGDWIAFLDADDEWYSDHLQRSAAALEANDDVASMSHFRQYDIETGRWIERRPSKTNGRLSGLTNQDTSRLYTEPQSNGWPTVGMVVNRERFSDIGGFDTDLICRHDADMFVRLVHNHTWSYIPRVTWFFRRRTTGSLSANQPECAYYWLRSILKASDLLPGEAMQQMVAHQARVAMGAALRSGNRKIIRRTSRLAMPYLSPRWRTFAQASLLAPVVGRKILEITDRSRSQSKRRASGFRVGE